MLVVAAVAWVVVRGLLAKSALDAAMTDADAVVSAAQDGDIELAREKLDDLGENAASAASLTGDPVWRAAELIPFAGGNLAAVRIASASADVLVNDVAAPVLDVSEALTPGDGRMLDLEALRVAQPELRDAAASASSAVADLEGVDVSAILPPLASGVTSLTEKAKQVAPLISGASVASELLPGLLGADEARTILVMVQNNAELRTGGGITGTFLELRAEGGSIDVVSQTDSRDFPRLTEPVTEVPASTIELYGDAVATRIQNVSMPADFPTSGRLASAWWQTTHDSTPDAVVSIDPLVLRAVISAGGPLETSAGELTSANFLEWLLVKPYLTLDQAGQSDLFEEVSLAAFDDLSSGGIDAMGLAAALAAPIDEGRVSVWSSHDDEQAILAATPLAGPAARQSQVGQNGYALYLNDSTGGKMDNFLEVSPSIGSAVCRADGLSDVEVRVALTNTAPADVVNLPTAMTGGGLFGVTPGDISTVLTVSAPAGSFQGAVTVGGEAENAAVLEDAGFPVSATTPVVLGPGESTEVVFRFTSASADPVDPVLLHTPLLSSPEIGALTPACG